MEVGERCGECRKIKVEGSKFALPVVEVVEPKCFGCEGNETWLLWRATSWQSRFVFLLHSSFDIFLFFSSTFPPLLKFGAVLLRPSSNCVAHV